MHSHQPGANLLRKSLRLLHAETSERELTQLEGRPGPPRPPLPFGREKLRLRVSKLAAM